MAFRKVAALTFFSAALLQNSVEADRDAARSSRGRQAATISSPDSEGVAAANKQAAANELAAAESKSQTWTKNSPKVYFDEAAKGADEQLRYAEQVQKNAKEAANSMTMAAHHLDLYHKDIIKLNEKLPLLDEIPSAINKHIFAELDKEEDERVLPAKVSTYEKYYPDLDAFQARVKADQEANGVDKEGAVGSDEAAN
mmetsp:Transcript_6336/g.9013  ORF Transcript_6336/g.9013 Transcript_6336/m.9013 type:complete len:198 (+) Transcript_6336:64-657(+)